MAPHLSLFQMAGARLSMSVIGPIVVLFVVFLHSGFRSLAIEPFALFRHSDFDYMCFTVMFYRRGRGPLCERAYVGNLQFSELRVRFRASKTGLTSSQVVLYWPFQGGSSVAIVLCSCVCIFICDVYSCHRASSLFLLVLLEGYASYCGIFWVSSLIFFIAHLRVE